MVLIKINGRIVNLSTLSSAEFIPASKPGWKVDRLKLSLITGKHMIVGPEARRLWEILEQQVHQNFESLREAQELELGGPGQARPVQLVRPAPGAEWLDQGAHLAG